MKNSLVGFTSEPFWHLIEREKNWVSFLVGLGCGVADGFHFPKGVVQGEQGLRIVATKGDHILGQGLA